MTGPQHYQEAERLAVKAAGYTGLPNTAFEQSTRLAQVHATLALAAATALPAAVAGDLREDDCADWCAAAEAQS